MQRYRVPRGVGAFTGTVIVKFDFRMLVGGSAHRPGSAGVLAGGFGRRLARCSDNIERRDAARTRRRGRPRYTTGGSVELARMLDWAHFLLVILSHIGKDMVERKFGVSGTTYAR